MELSLTVLTIIPIFLPLLFIIINNYNIIIAAISEFDNQFSIKLDNESIKMTIDLSVPSFFNDEMFESDLIQRIDIDMASEIINTTLVQRKSSIENAEIILKKYIQEFKQWDYINENYVKQWKNNFSDITISFIKIGYNTFFTLFLFPIIWLLFSFYQENFIGGRDA